MISNARKLKYGQAYTINTLEIKPSWVKISLVETGKDVYYSLHWFKSL